MLQGGPSRELLEMWAPDARNGLIVTGYSVEGTLARVSCCLRVDWYLVHPLYILHEYIFFAPKIE